MANTDPHAPKGIDMPALRKQRKVSYNLMASGPGTPWEDRDSLGYIPAFFKTCTKVMRDPETLFGLIRRLQHRTDARLFVIGIAILWFLSGMIHGCIAYLRLALSAEGRAPHNLPHLEIDIQAFFLAWAVFSLALAVLVFGLFEIAARIYYPMVSGGDMKGRGSPELVYNVLAYCMGPSVLVLVPYAGPVVALAWIFGLAIWAGMNRLRINTRGAAVCAAISLGSCLVIALLLLGAGYKVWGWSYDPASKKVTPKIQYREAR
jgi:hypothetical protein